MTINALKKWFVVKIYSKNWTYKETISPNDIMSDIFFNSFINWIQWECNIQLNRGYDDTSIVWSDIAKIYESDKNNLTWRLIYSWLIQKVNRIYSSNYDYIELPIIWLWSLFSFELFKNSWNYIFSLDQDPAETVRDIVDYINSIYWSFFSYDWNSIINYWNNVDISFDNNYCFDSIKKCLSATNFYFFINQYWKVFFKQKSWIVSHTLMLEKNVDNIEIEEDYENIKNKLILKYWAGTQIYEDSTSQSNYWLKTIYIDQSSTLATIDDANEFWNNFILNNKNPKIKTRIIVNSNYDIESISVWDTIKVLNISYSINNLQMVRIDYKVDTAVLYLEDYDSFSKEVFKN